MRRNVKKKKRRSGPHTRAAQARLQAAQRPPLPEAAPSETAEPQRPLWMLLVQQLALTVLVLCVFALFHHVLPRFAKREAPAAPVAVYAQETAPAQMTPTPVPREEAAETPEPAAETGPFTAEIVRTEDSYSGPTLAFTVTKYDHPAQHPEQTYYVADVYVKSAEQLSAAFPPENALFGDPELIARNAGAVLAINGDNATGDVFSVRNGVLCRNAAHVPGDICVLYRDGSMEIYPAGGYEPEALLAAEPWQIWCFGPSLLDAEGRPLTEFNIDRSLQVRHPRTAIGCWEPGHYCLVVIDGRNPEYSKGATMEETAQIMAELGCRLAYNLDGGASSLMIREGKLISLPSKSRLVTDMIVLRELGEEGAP